MGNLQRRISLVVVGLIVATQAATVATVLAQAGADARQRALEQLELGCAVVREFMNQRTALLNTTADVLMSDFGFRRAVASGALPTVRSVLKNHSARIGAGYAVLLSPDGDVLANTDAAITHEAIDRAAWTELTLHANETLTLPVAGNRAYQMVAAPVRAPEIIAWVAVGFPIDDALADEIKRIVGMEVSFASYDGTRAQLLASTLSAEAAADHDRYYRVDDTLGTLGTELLLSLRTARTDALSAFHELSRSMLLLGLLALAAGVFATIAMSRRLARPILDLARVTSKIRDGDYDVRVDLDDRDEIGDLARTIDSMQTEIKSREARIREQATHDDLTGLPNRDLAAANLASLLIDPGAGVSVMVVAFHGVQDVNSSLGLTMGEAVIRAVADRLRRLVDADEQLARVADTRFLVFLPNQLPDRAEQLARTMVNELSLLTIDDDVDVSLTIGVGIASFPEHGHDPHELIRKAWVASMATDTRGQRFALYEPQTEARHARRLALTQSLRAAEFEHQVELFYQPKVDAASRRPIGAEALLRWHHPELGAIPPDEFIPLAEGSGSIQRITRWVLRQAIAELATQPASLTMAVNVSARDISDTSFPALVAALLTEHGVGAERLELEITESDLLDDLPKALMTLQKLRALAVRIAIDDYGTGFSSLGQLKQLPVDTLKIDKSFVMNLDTSPDDEVIVRSTIELAHSLALGVVAEGVESEHAARLLTEWGCDVLQGYHFAKPMPVSALNDWLAQAPAPAVRIA